MALFASRGGPGAPGNWPRPRDGFRRRTAGTDGASRSRYRCFRPREERGGRVRRPPPRLGAPPGPWRRTRRPEEPSTRTPAQSRPAGALRWRVTITNRSEFGNTLQRTRRGALAPSQTTQRARHPGRARTLGCMGLLSGRPEFAFNCASNMVTMAPWSFRA